jgi:hypothetical protein
MGDHLCFESMGNEGHPNYLGEDLNHLPCDYMFLDTILFYMEINGSFMLVL